MKHKELNVQNINVQSECNVWNHFKHTPLVNEIFTFLPKSTYYRYALWMLKRRKDCILDLHRANEFWKQQAKQNSVWLKHVKQREEGIQYLKNLEEK